MKKILIITYYWPPAGGGGVQRWLKFAKYLPEYNVQPVIAIPENADYPVIDESLKTDIPKNIETIKIPIWEPYSVFKLLSRKKKSENVNSGLLGKSKKKSAIEKLALWLRGNILIPDPRIFWIKPAQKKLLRYLADTNIATVITTGPPHSVHLIGLKLKKKTGVNWIADFRDPWSEIDYLEIFKPSALAMKFQKSLEKKVLISADKVLVVSKNWADDLKKLGARNVEVITNGYDEEDFKNFNYNYPTDKLTLLYSGILHDYRNPKFLWDALETICSEDDKFAQLFELKLFGTIDEGVVDYIKSLPALSERFYYGGYIKHNELINEYEKASVLLLLQNNTKNALGHIPGKLFEYLASEKKIVAIGPGSGSDVVNILQKSNAGMVIDSKDAVLIKDKLYAYLNASELDKQQSSATKVKHMYSRQSLTKQLSELV